MTIATVTSMLNRLEEFFVGATRWSPVDDAASRVGDRDQVLMGIGSIDAGRHTELPDWGVGQFCRTPRFARRARYSSSRVCSLAAVKADCGW